MMVGVPSQSGAPNAKKEVPTIVFGKVTPPSLWSSAG
jgi:hypothetical protein